MMNASNRSKTKSGYHVPILISLFTFTLCCAHGAETKVAKGHICSGCVSCDQSVGSQRKTLVHNCLDDFHRAGHPETQGRFAKPSLNRHNSFGYVGGGSAFHGEPRYYNEGTWGLDYSGILFSKRIWLQWWHGHPKERTGGSYEPDGPHFLGHH